MKVIFNAQVLVSFATNEVYKSEKDSDNKCFSLVSDAKTQIKRI